MRNALSTTASEEIDWMALDARGTCLPMDAIEGIVREHFSLEGVLAHLAYERDDVYPAALDVIPCLGKSPTD